MNTNKNATRGGGTVASKKLLAALAVLAVAFVVLAAVPAVATDSDAADSTSTGELVAIGAISDKTEAQAYVDNFIGGDYKVNAHTMFAIFQTTGTESASDVTVVTKVSYTDDSGKKQTVTVDQSTYGASGKWFVMWDDSGDSPKDFKWIDGADYKISVKIGSDKAIKHTISTDDVRIYSDRTISKDLTIPEDGSITVVGHANLTVSKGATLTVSKGATLSVEKGVDKSTGLATRSLIDEGAIVVEDGGKLILNTKLTGAGSITVASADGLILRECAQLYNDDASALGFTGKITIAGDEASIYTVSTKTVGTLTVYESYEKAIEAAVKADAESAILVEPLAMGSGRPVTPTVTSIDLSDVDTGKLASLYLLSFNNNGLSANPTGDWSEAKAPLASIAGDLDLSGTLSTLSLAGISLSKAKVTGLESSSATITSTGWTTRLAAGSIAVDWDGASDDITIDDATGTVRVAASKIANLTVIGDGKDKTTVVFENDAVITGAVKIESSTVQSEGKLTVGSSSTSASLSIDSESAVSGTMSVEVANASSILDISKADTTSATVTVSSDVAASISLPKGSSYSIDSTISLYANDDSVINYDSSSKALIVTSGSVSVVGGKLGVKTLTVTAGTFSGRIDATDDVTIGGAGTVSSNIDLAAGKTLTLKSGITYSGTVKYLTNSLVFTGVKLGADSTVKAFAATTGTDAVAAHLEISGSYDAAGTSATVVLNGNAIQAGAVSVGENTVLTISSGAVLTVPASITVNSTSTSGDILAGKGKVSVAGTLSILALDAAKAVDIHVDVVSGGSITYATDSTSALSDVSYDSESIKTANMSGDFQDASYGAAQRVEVVGDSTVTGTLTIEGSLHVNSGVTLTVAPTGKVVLKNSGTSIIEGTLILQGDSTDKADLSIEDSAVLQVQGNLTVAGNLSVAETAKIQFMQGSTSSVGGELTAKNAVIDDSASLTVTGAIKSGTVFKNGGTLIINSSDVSDAFEITLTTASAAVDIEKITTSATSTKITIKDQGSYGTSKVTTTKSGYNFKDKANEIDITLSGTNATTQPDGAISVVVLTGVHISESTSAKKLNDTEKTIYSSIDTYTMVLSGTMAVAGQVVYSGTETTYPVDPAATVDIKGNTAAAIGETSFGTNLTVASSGTLSVTGAVSLAASTSRAEGTTTGHTYNLKTYSSSLTLGSSTSDKVSVKAAITVGAGATLESKGTTTVSAPVDATAQVGTPAVSAEFKNSGVLKLDGSGSVKVLGTSATAAPITTSVHGAAYYTNAGTTTTPIYVWNYVTVDSAIAALVAGTTTAVTLYGDNVLAASAEIPSGSTVALASDATLKVGKDSEATDVVLNIADGAKLNGASNVITVYGTLYAVKVTDITSSLRGAIVSDVSSYATTATGAQDNTSWAKWTNLATALDEAVSGERIVISGSDRTIDLAANATVKEGVTLDLNGNILAVEQKYTLAVAGTLDLTDGGLLYLADSTVDSETKKTTAAAGIVSYTGYIQYDTDAVSGSVKIATMTKTSSSTTWAIPNSANTTLVLPGAYYSVESSGIQYNILTSYANGAANAKDAVADSTTGISVSLIADKDGAISLGEISFAGTSSASPVIVAYGDVSGTITLSYAQFFVGYGTTTSGYDIDAVFKAADGATPGSIQVKGTTGTSTVTESGNTYKWGFNVTAGDYPAGATDAKQVIGFGGALADSDYTDDSGATVKVATSLTVTDTVYAMTYVDLTVDKVSVAGDLILTGEDGKTGTSNAEISTLDVSGSLAIDAGSDLTVKALTVSGSVVINDGELTADKAEVTGSIDATAVDDNNLSVATLTVGKLYIGIAAKKITGADASVTGNVAISDATGYAVKAAGATAPAAWDTSDKYKSTVYSVDGSEYVTVYVLSTSSLTIDTVKAPSVENATFQYWQAGTSDASSHYIGESGYTAVTAKIKTDIYTVTINADGGVNYITLNGKLMKNPSGNEFTLSGLTAGEYTVAVSPKTGYDISKVALYDSTSAAVGSMIITLSGTDDTSFTYSLIGSTATSTSGTGGSTDVSGIIDAINKNTEAVKEQEKNITVNSSSDDDNDLTNILLVVLVILIIVMAILVAMRMMRS